MRSSAVYPIGVPPVFAMAQPLAAMPMKNYEGTPGTAGSVLLRFGQVTFAAMSFSIMISAENFTDVSAFCYLAAATIAQCIWSLPLAFIDIHALLVKRNLRNSAIIKFYVIGDWLISTLIFAAACSTSGISVLIENDLKECNLNPCTKYHSASGMAYFCWMLETVSFILAFHVFSTQ